MTLPLMNTGELAHQYNVARDYINSLGGHLRSASLKTLIATELPDGTNIYKLAKRVLPPSDAGPFFSAKLIENLNQLATDILTLDLVKDEPDEHIYGRILVLNRKFNA